MNSKLTPEDIKLARTYLNKQILSAARIRALNPSAIPMDEVKGMHCAYAALDMAEQFRQRDPSVEFPPLGEGACR